MNKIIKSIVLFLFLITNQVVAENNYTLSQAVRLKLVSYTITGTEETLKEKSSLNNETGHFGPCLKLVVANLSNQQISLMLDAGTVLYPNDTSYQQMIVTENWNTSLDAKSKKNDKLIAMCGQPFHKSPTVNVNYKLGEKADKKIQEVVRIIQEMELQNGFGQELLWTAIDPVYLYTFRNNADKSPSNAFIALTLNKSGIMGAKEMLRFIPFRPDTLNIKITRRDTVFQTFHLVDTLHKNITMVDTSWKKQEINYSNLISKKVFDQAKESAERDMTTSFFAGLALLSFAAGMGGFVIGRISRNRKEMEMEINTNDEV